MYKSKEMAQIVTDVWNEGMIGAILKNVKIEKDR